MNVALDPVAHAALDRYLTLLDAVLPGGWVYLTGSAALGDWRPGRSDLDILVATSGQLAESTLDALAALHAAMPDRPYRDAIYLPRDRLGEQPGHDSPELPHTVDGVFHRDGYRPDPVLWATFDRHGLTIRGPAATGLGVAPDPDWLRDWNLANLGSYWRPWSANARTMLADRDPETSLPAYPVVWAVTGPGRLHHTICTGAIISKTAAADYTAELFPHYADLVARAKAWRLSGEMARFTTADGHLSCDLVDAVVDDAQRRSLRRAP